MRSAARRVIHFYWGRGIADDVPALTYYLVLSLAPLALGLAAVEALLLEDYLSALDVVRQVNRFLPDSLHHDVERLVLGTRDNSPWLLVLAVVTMLWTMSGGIGVVERCLSRLLDCPRHPMVVGRLRNVVLGAGVALVFVVAAAGAPVIGDVAEHVHLRGALPGAMLLAVNTAGSIAMFAAIFRWAPLGHLHWRSALLGAVPAAVGVQLAPALIGVYVEAAAGLAPVRLFVAIAVILFGLYAMATAMLLGAGIAARAELRRAGRGGEIGSPRT